MHIFGGEIKLQIKPIKNKQDYEAALRTVEPMFDDVPLTGTPEGDFFEVMCVLISDYENKNFPVENPDPVDAIKFRMEQLGLTVKDLEPAIGKSNRVYEVLNRKRSLTLPMIRKLNAMFGIPLRSLVGR
ncbi:transcriptional regulator [Salmonella enterica]|uniref:helix-turn-helix domain-containing protein n=1 Tax=Salmonella sp. 741265070_HSA TaxID=3388995 RepID=UPI0029379E6A|nr:transcriptional regulator [Salmonella enterica]EIJ8290742.1 transcriptional regulator [Salmonella enterica]EJK3902598.1 transcriptional regulator [Salmonella enterica]ELQ6511341.1 transcriptional regulator [Salmonella enterica]ELS9673807.1 transcriptional regulator [Salmonella enterica]